jgi:hypothetical protein
MTVSIDTTRCRDPTFRIKLARSFRQFHAHLYDPAVGHADIGMNVSLAVATFALRITRSNAAFIDAPVKPVVVDKFEQI